MRYGRLLVLFILFALISRLCLCVQPAEELIPKVASDDMFYYLCIARNVAGGYGATVDRENATNGFHPLWAIILVPFFKYAHPGSEIQWALCLMTLFSVFSAWFLYRIVRFACGEVSSLLAAVIWLCCPYTVLVALAGVEAPLFVFLAGACSYFYLSIRARGAGSGASLHRWISLGLLMGAATLARIDGALLAVIVFIDSLISKKRIPVPVGRRLLQAFSYGIACVIVTLPWFIWSYRRTGLVFQMSGSAIYHQQHVVFWARYGNAGAVRYAAAWCVNLLSNMHTAVQGVAALCGVGPVAFYAALGLCAFALITAARRKKGLFDGWLKRISAFNFLFCYGFLMLFLYCAYLWYSQDWYYYSIVFTACVLGGCVFDLLDEWLNTGPVRFFRAPLWGIFLVCVVLLSSCKTLYWWRNGIRGWQIDMYRAAIWVKENIPPDGRIGSFNSGILAYYCPQTVINLDGVANGAAYRAIRQRRIFSYVREAGIGYIVEAPRSLRFRQFQSAGDPPPTMNPLHAEASYPEAARRNNPVTVYEVMK